EEENNIDIELNFEEYCNHFYKVDTSIYEYNNYLIYISLNEVKFNEEEELLIDEYNNIYNSDNNDDIDNIMSSSSSGSSDKDKEYYFLTGTECPSEYVNSQYNFNSIWVGDILFEEMGGPSNILHHTAIIEGQFYSSTLGIYYWRVIEAVSEGVTRGVLDDNRFVERKGHLLYCPDSTSSQRSGAVNFCINQLGKDYALMPALWNTSSNRQTWYCSILINSAYESQGFWIVKINWAMRIAAVWYIFPTDLKNSDKTLEYKSY
ncbi:MAG TPA: hypothetical protein GX708_02575, partial [Gallicola sp.]|nr:hypothetical protein [Gallicola sp.]